MSFISVSEVMSRSPIAVLSSLTVREAAEVMKEKGVSSLLIQEGGEYIGIVTERDIVTKVASEGLDPAGVKVREIMSSPLIYVDADSPLEIAAEIMWKRKIRRLPVRRGGKVVGLLTENDIVRISPGLIEITRGIMGDRNEGIVKGIHGICDSCHEFSENLIYRAGSYYCERCYSKTKFL
ncbi:MAG: cyclic nucleotide-binding/CBS domain-containing protein [Thermoplasmata archaeon]